MLRPPRKLSDPLFGRRMIIAGLIQGLGVFAIVLAVYSFILRLNIGDGEARMISFLTLVIGNLGLIFTNRSWKYSIISTLRIPNPALWWVTGATLFFLSLAVFIPFLRNVFSFDVLHLWEAGLIGATGLLSIIIPELLKLRPIEKLMDKMEA
jgi:Ca2+-transporting ATPase